MLLCVHQTFGKWASWFENIGRIDMWIVVLQSLRETLKKKGHYFIEKYKNMHSTFDFKK